MSAQSKFGTAFLRLMLVALFVLFTATACDDEPSFEDQADECIGNAQKIVDDAAKAKEKAEKAGDADAARIATIKGKAASNAKKKCETAKRKSKKAKENKNKDDAEENEKFAKKVKDEADAIINDINSIPKARKTLRDLGFTKKQIDDMLAELDDADAKATETGQPGTNYKRYAGFNLREIGVDVSGDEGKRKIDEAAKAIEDLFHGEGTVGDGADAPYPE